MFGTIVHELAHVVSVMAEGGTVLSIDVVPSGDPVFRFGEVRWIPNADENRPLIAMAPTFVWTWLALSTATLAPKVLHRDLASRVALIAGFFLPLADASLAASGMFCRVPRSDWVVAFGGHEVAVAFAFAAYITLFGELGLSLVRRCWGRGALSSWEYSALYIVALALPWARHVSFSG